MVADLISDLGATAVRERLSELNSALTNAVGAPTEPTYQQQVSEFRAASMAALRSSKVNQYPAAWTQYLIEMQIADTLGERLAQRIEDSFNSNQVTLATVAQEITVLAAELDRVHVALVETDSGLTGLNVGNDQLSPGEVELGFLIPRDAVREELGALGKEYIQLKLVIGPFLELATGGRPEIKVRGTSSSDFGLWLDVGVEVASIVGPAVAFLIERYKTLLDIRKLKAEIERLQLPEVAVEAAEQHATAQITDAVAELTETIMTTYGENLNGPERTNEVRADLQFSLTEIARRIDLSYSIQVRSLAPLYESDENGDVPADVQEYLDAHAEIAGVQKTLEYRRLEGSPVLGLTPGQEVDSVAKQPDEG